jgi:hypothetical protein
MLVSMTRLLAMLVVVGVVAGCGGRDSDANGRVVAEIDGRFVTVSQVQDYFDAVLAMGEGDEIEDAELASRAEMDRIKSRLFDGYVDEEVLLFEAERLGVRVEPWEVEVYLGGVTEEEAEPAEPVGPDDASFRIARRNLMIQKLRGAVVGAEVRVTDEEVDAYLERHRSMMLPDDHLIVRRLALGGKKEANDVRREIIEKSMPFDKAAAIFGSEPHQGRPEQIEIEALPEAMRKAVEKLKPGQISRPVEFGGAYHLLLLEAWPAKQEADEGHLRARAAAELRRIHSAEISDRLLARLREEIEVRIYPEHLPFGYVQD